MQRSLQQSFYRTFHNTYSLKILTVLKLAFTTAAKLNFPEQKDLQATGSDRGQHFFPYLSSRRSSVQDKSIKLSSRFHVPDLSKHRAAFTSHERSVKTISGEKYCDCEK